MNTIKKSSTIIDVAKRAGVSIGSVSRYINGKKLKLETSEKVSESIEFLKYEENLTARGLKKRKSMIIGALIYDLQDSFSLEILSAFEKSIEKNRYSLLIADYENDELTMQNRIKLFKQRSVDGLICFPYSNYGLSQITIDLFNDLNIPFININEYFPEINGDCVMVDNSNASFRAVEHLINRGNKDIVIINGNEYDYVSKERLKGYREALDLYGIENKKENELYGNYSVSGAYQEILKVFERNKKPDAIFTTNYRMANGFLLAMTELNIEVPKDVEFITFDKSDIVEFLLPQISYIEQPLKEIGEIASERLLERINNKSTGMPEIIQLKTRFVIKNRD